MCGRLPQHDSDLLRRCAVAEQPRDRLADRLDLGQFARRLEHPQARAGLERSGGPLHEPALDCEQQAVVGVVGVRLAAGPLVGAQLPQSLAQAGAGCQGVAVLVGYGDGHLGHPGELGHQVELLASQVVEAVEEDGPSLPGIAAGAQASDSSAREGVGVAAAQLVADLGVPAEQPRQLALVVARALRPLGEVPWLQADSLQLVDQRRHGPREAGAPTRARQQSQIGAVRTLAGHADPLHGRKRGGGGGPHGLGDLFEELRECADPPAHHPAEALTELALKAVGVIQGGNDQDRVPAQARPEAVQDRTRAARVRGPRDQLQTHSAVLRIAGQHRRAGGATRGPQTAPKCG